MKSLNKLSGLSSRGVLLLSIGLMVGCTGSLLLEPNQATKQTAAPTSASDKPNSPSASTPPVKAGASVSLVQVIPERLVMEVGKESSALATVRYDDNTTDSNLIWNSSDNTIASVDPIGGQIRGLKSGEVTIIATAARDNSKRAALQVSVRGTVTEAALVNISPETLTLKKGTSGVLKATVKLADGRDSSNLSWNTSNRAVAIIKANGSSVTVTGVGAGTAMITATSDDDPTKSVSATVTVE
jgi:uncharacterized protein YjdB